MELTSRATRYTAQSRRSTSTRPNSPCTTSASFVAKGRDSTASGNGLSAGEEDVVFVERKTHRGQRWTGSQSSKERFPLEALAVGALLRGACDIDEQVARMVARGRLREEQASATRELGADIHDPGGGCSASPAAHCAHRLPPLRLSAR